MRPAKDFRGAHGFLFRKISLFRAAGEASPPYGVLCNGVVVVPPHGETAPLSLRRASPELISLHWVEQSKEKAYPNGYAFSFGSPTENRTPDSALRGLRLNRLTMRP